MDRIKRIVTEGIESYLRHMINEDNQFGNGDGSAKAKMVLIDTLKSLKEVTLYYGQDQTLELEGGERYNFTITYTLSTNAYTESYYSNTSGPETDIMNDDTDDLSIDSITAWDDDTEEELEIDDSDGRIEDLIRKKYVVDDSDYDYPTKDDYMDDLSDLWH